MGVGGGEGQGWREGRSKSRGASRRAGLRAKDTEGADDHRGGSARRDGRDGARGRGAAQAGQRHGEGRRCSGEKGREAAVGYRAALWPVKTRLALSPPLFTTHPFHPTLRPRLPSASRSGEGVGSDRASLLLGADKAEWAGLGWPPWVILRWLGGQVGA